jgi:hypothetical protein
MKRLLLIVLFAVPVFGQRLASDFEIAQMEKQLASVRSFQAQLSARLNLGDARAARNERSLARSEYAKALEIATKERLDARRDSSMGRYAMATSYAALAEAKLGRAPAAFALVEEAVRYTSDDPETWNLYASAMRLIDRPQKAVSAARNAVTLADPDKPLDVAVYQHSLASMLVENEELEEAERLLVTVTESLRSPAFDSLKRAVARAEAFEVHSSARGDVAAYVSLLNRAQLRLASLYERRGATAKAREQYERVLAARSDDATALAGLARLAATSAERERHYAEAFAASPFSLTLVREYQEYLTAGETPRETGHAVQKALVHLAQGETRAARAILDALLAEFPANETLKTLRREADVRAPAIPAANATPAELRALLEGFEQLAPEHRVALDAATFTSVVRFHGRALDGTIGDVPFRFAEETVFHGDFDFTQPLELTYRIAGVAGDALLLEPVSLRTATIPAAHREESRVPSAAGRRVVSRRYADAPSDDAAIVDTPRGIVVAVHGRVRLGERWDVAGVPYPTSIAASADRVAVLDALNDQAVIVDLATGKSTHLQTAATPVAAAFVGGDLYILARDARLLQRAGGESTPVPQDSAFLAVTGGKLYVYSRITGTINGEIRNAPFASDFEGGYLVYPRESRLRAIDGTAIDVGAVPVDVAVAGGGTALTARILVVADPSSKRIWLTEGQQSTGKAVARGFLRGFLGLGLFGNRSSRFPTGVDRVLARGSRWIAYDSSSGTVYRVTRQQSSVIAKGIAPNAFALTAEGVAIWQNGRIEERQ